MKYPYADRIDDLLPCPFCGGESAMQVQGNNLSKKKKRAIAHCKACAAEVAQASLVSTTRAAEYAMEMWNKRV